MKEIKEKPTKRVPRSNAAGKIPKAALKKAFFCCALAHMCDFLIKQ